MQIVELFANAANKHRGSIKLAVIDHITKLSAAMLPVRKIASVLKSKGIQVVVDGAHAPGQGILLVLWSIGVWWR